MEPSPDPLADLRAEVAAAAGELAGGGSVSPRLDRSRRPEFGDYSTNAAMELAPGLRRAPREVANGLGEAVEARLGDAVERVEVAGPGFLNLFMSDVWRREALARVLGAGEGFGRPGAEPEPESVLIEFVSANPTGPITVASGRHAAYGDSLARVLEWAGHRVWREFYVNDHGTQVRRFGESIRARARGEEPPPDGYRGAYVAELADAIPGAADADPEVLAAEGVERMVAWVRSTLERFGVRFDAFFSERSLHDSGALERIVGLPRRARGGLPQRGRGVASLERPRRRQGPGPDPLLRRDHLLRRRHRLPRGQARAGLRPGHRRAGRRPPRLRRTHEGGLGGARRRSRRP
ncbi:MAG: arginine--tRNA ligase [Thermoleophilaceae bacterium]